MLNRAEIRDDNEATYRGLKIHTAANLHRDCIGLIKTLSLLRNSSVLDLGAGAGAFSRRLMDTGFAVTAVEYKPQRFRAGADCYSYDLNQDFSDRLQKRFDLVVAIEIIEHLANPRHFIRNCLAALKKDGYLLITSPNAESWLSRLIFLRRGRFLWFDENDYEHYGHITPIFTWQIEQICHEFGARLIRSERIHSSLRKRLGTGFIQILKNKLTYMSGLYPLMAGRKQGEVNIYLIQK
ncbi:MAG: class I SAM-dependent methyltransferase [Blastocatellia bacterium]